MANFGTSYIISRFTKFFQKKVFYVENFENSIKAI